MISPLFKHSFLLSSRTVFKFSIQTWHAKTLALNPATCTEFVQNSTHAGGLHRRDHQAESTASMVPAQA